MQYSDITRGMSKNASVKNLGDVMLSEYKNDWLTGINAIHGASGRGGNKLRTYCTAKQEYSVEEYCKNYNA